jgi:hypothetical protein
MLNVIRLKISIILTIVVITLYTGILNSNFDICSFDDGISIWEQCIDKMQGEWHLMLLIYTAGVSVIIALIPFGMFIKVKDKD